MGPFRQILLGKIACRAMVSNRMKRDLAIRALKPLRALLRNALPVSGWL